MSRGGVNADIAELCLNHSLSALRRTYDRHEYEAEKRHAFEALVRMVESIARPPAGSVVVPFSSAEARRQ
jgi:hypothetical protein